MGNIAYRSSPITHKTSQATRHNSFLVVSSEMQGWRTEMQDQKIIKFGVCGNQNWLMVGVFDGHGSSQVSKFCALSIHALFQQCFTSRQLIPAALVQAFGLLDAKLLSAQGLNFVNSLRGGQGFQGYPVGGSTACVCLITQTDIYTANAGDSRAVVLEGGIAKALSRDHKPTDQDQRARILMAGGRVQLGRINFGLNLSRAVGDFQYKMNAKLPNNKQMVISEPQVSVTAITRMTQLLLVGCDGIFQRYDNQAQVLMSFLRKRCSEIGELAALEEMQEKLMASDLSQQVGCDNMTAVDYMIKDCLGCKKQFRTGEILSESEGVCLQFKDYSFPLACQDMKYSLLKIINAMLNTQGGIILMSVDHSKKVNGQFLDKEAKRQYTAFLQELTSCITPPLQSGQVRVIFVPVFKGQDYFESKFVPKIVVRSSVKTLYMFDSVVQLHCQDSIQNIIIVNAFRRIRNNTMQMQANEISSQIKRRQGLWKQQVPIHLCNQQIQDPAKLGRLKIDLVGSRIVRQKVMQWLQRKLQERKVQTEITQTGSRTRLVMRSEESASACIQLMQQSRLKEFLLIQFTIKRSVLHYQVSLIDLKPPNKSILTQNIIYQPQKQEVCPTRLVLPPLSLKKSRFVMGVSGFKDSACKHAVRTILADFQQHFIMQDQKVILIGIDREDLCFDFKKTVKSIKISNERLKYGILESVLIKFSDNLNPSLEKKVLDSIKLYIPYFQNQSTQLGMIEVRGKSEEMISVYWSLIPILKDGGDICMHFN